MKLIVRESSAHRSPTTRPSMIGTTHREIATDSLHPRLCAGSHIATAGIYILGINFYVKD